MATAKNTISVRPYYEHAGITIYHGDCREILPTVPSPDFILSDPPYGMNYKPLRGADGSRRWAEGVRGDDQDFSPTHLMRYPRCVLFGANWYANLLPPSGGWLVWDKTPRGHKEGFHASHAELAWTNCCSSVRKFSLQWGGEARGGEPFYHPTQKPVALMAWILKQFTQAGELVVDPYMGAGPVIEACRDLGRRAIGIEIEERYCEIAAKRLSQEVLDLAEVPA